VTQPASRCGPHHPLPGRRPRPGKTLGGNLLTLLDGGGALNGNGNTSRPAETACTEMLALNPAKFRLAGRTIWRRTADDWRRGRGSIVHRPSSIVHRQPLRLAHFAPVLPQLLEVKDRPAGEVGPVTDPEIAERLRAMGYLE
jgi:hypothetical protein